MEDDDLEASSINDDVTVNAAYPTIVPLFKAIAGLDLAASRMANALAELSRCIDRGAGEEFRKAFRWVPPESGLPKRGVRVAVDERRAWLDWESVEGVTEGPKRRGEVFLPKWGQAFDESFLADARFRGLVKRSRELIQPAAAELRAALGTTGGDPAVHILRAVNALRALFPDEGCWQNAAQEEDAATKWATIPIPPAWRDWLRTLRAAAWTKGTAAKPVAPVTEAVGAEIARKILTQMPAASPEPPTPPKVSGYTKKELIDAVRIAIGRENWSPSAFDNIRKAARVKARARGGAGSFQRFTNAEIRNLAAAAQAGTFRFGKQIGVALRELITPPPGASQSNHKL